MSIQNSQAERLNVFLDTMIHFNLKLPTLESSVPMTGLYDFIKRTKASNTLFIAERHSPSKFRCKCSAPCHATLESLQACEGIV